MYTGARWDAAGNYLVLLGDHTPAEVKEMMRATMEFIAGFDGEIPGATPRDCGNYSYMNLDEARRQARRFLDEVIHDPHMPTEYPE